MAHRPRRRVTYTQKLPPTQRRPLIEPEPDSLSMVIDAIRRQSPEVIGRTLAVRPVAHGVTIESVRQAHAGLVGQISLISRELASGSVHPDKLPQLTERLEQSRRSLAAINTVLQLQSKQG